jgi:CRP-like cAMP-binding protein
MKTPYLLMHKLQSFKGLTEASKSSVTQIATLHYFKKGQNLVAQDQICKHLFFVEEGCIRTFTIHDGNEINLSFTFENHFATSLKSLRQGIPSELTLQAMEPTTVYVFEKDALFGLYKSDYQIESFGKSIIEELLEAQEDHSNLFKLYTPAERYYFLQQHFPEIIQRISLSHLASYLGVARETLSRIRKIKS